MTKGIVERVLDPPIFLVLVLQSLDPNQFLSSVNNSRNKIKHKGTTFFYFTLKRTIKF